MAAPRKATAAANSKSTPRKRESSKPSATAPQARAAAAGAAVKAQRSTAGRKRDRRLADVVAEKIREEIIALGWPVGRVLGSESELLARYQVSRSVFRQAVRLLEYNQIARMRPGPGSGLIVTEPDSAATRRTLGVYLEYKKVSLEHILEAMSAIELACVKLAAERITADGIHRLRDVIARERNAPPDEIRNSTENNVHILLAELTGNPAMHLFVEVLTALSLTHAPKRITKKIIEHTNDVHGELAEAVISGDVALAMHRMRRHLDELGDTLY